MESLGKADGWFSPLALKERRRGERQGLVLQTGDRKLLNHGHKFSQSSVPRVSISLQHGERHSALSVVCSTSPFMANCCLTTEESGRDSMKIRTFASYGDITNIFKAGLQNIPPEY